MAIYWLLISFTFFASGQEVTKSLARYPFEGVALDGRRIVTATNGSLWSIDRQSGEIGQLTATTSRDQQPLCHPNGEWLAFMRDTPNGGNLMLMNLETHKVRQLTFHPSRNWPIAWSPDGLRLIFASSRDLDSLPRLYEIAMDGAWPTAMDLPTGSEGVWLPDGRLAYVPHSRLPRFNQFRYYRGGLMSPIWVVDMNTAELVEVTDGQSNAYHPVVAANTLFYLDDRDGCANLYARSADLRQAMQHTKFKTHGIRALASWKDTIVFTRAGRLFLMETPQSEPADITPPFPLPGKQQNQTKTLNAQRWMTELAWSRPNTLTLTARGDVFLRDINQAGARNITQTSAFNEHHGQLSPDGRLLAYFTDAGGSYRLAIRDLESGQETTHEIEAKPSLYEELTWSKDNKRLCFSSRRLALWYFALGDAAPKVIATSPDPGQITYSPTWSPDGRFLAYQMRQDNRLPTIYLYDSDAGQNHPVTHGGIHATAPAFDASGRYLYFLISPNAPGDDFQWSLQSAHQAESRKETYLAAAILHPGDRSPLNGQQPNLQMDWDRTFDLPPNIATVRERLVHLDIGTHQMADILPGSPGVLYLTIYDRHNAPLRGQLPSTNLYRLNLRNPGSMARLARNADQVLVNPAGDQLLYHTGQAWRRITFEKGIPQREAFVFGALAKPAIAREEWQQMFEDCWRIADEMFYDPGLHGQDLPALRAHFSQYLDQVRDRTDLNVVLERMLGHLSVSHLFVTDGDRNGRGSQSEIGLLGADLQVDQNRYLFQKIMLQVPIDLGLPPIYAPLDQPGNRLPDGVYLIAIDDKPIFGTENLHERFWQLAERWVWLTVSEFPDGRNPQKFQVRTITNESSLRRANWVAENRTKVAELSQGRLGYLFIGQFNATGMSAFEAGFFSQRNKRGIIIDQRDNGGGTTADRLLELITRRPLYAYKFRHGHDLPVPVMAPKGSLVLITNFRNGSAAETFALMFQNAKVGPIVGTPTFGAGIGTWGWQNRLIDGSRVSMPNRGAFEPGSWAIENIGVQPNHKVTLTPALWRAGRDPYLEKAVEAALNAPAPPQTLKAPPFPIHPK